MKTDSTSATIMYNNKESGHPWWNLGWEWKIQIGDHLFWFWIGCWWKQPKSSKWIYSCNRTYKGKWDRRETEVLVHPVKIPWERVRDNCRGFVKCIWKTWIELFFILEISWSLFQFGDSPFVVEFLEDARAFFFVLCIMVDNCNIL